MSWVLKDHATPGVDCSQHSWLPARMGPDHLSPYILATSGRDGWQRRQQQQQQQQHGSICPAQCSKASPLPSPPLLRSACCLTCDWWVGAVTEPILGGTRGEGGGPLWECAPRSECWAACEDVPGAPAAAATPVAAAKVPAVPAAGGPARGGGCLASESVRSVPGTSCRCRIRSSSTCGVQPCVATCLECARVCVCARTRQSAPNLWLQELCTAEHRHKHTHFHARKLRQTHRSAAAGLLPLVLAAHGPVLG